MYLVFWKSWTWFSLFHGFIARGWVAYVKKNFKTVASIPCKRKRRAFTLEWFNQFCHRCEKKLIKISMTTHFYGYEHNRIIVRHELDSSWVTRQSKRCARHVAFRYSVHFTQQLKVDSVADSVLFIQSYSPTQPLRLGSARLGPLQFIVN